MDLISTLRQDSCSIKSPITVLMSVYNGETWLYEAIQSVMSQTFEDFEFVIVNDGSKDCSLDIINKYASVDHRIVVIDKPNTGLADSLNQGLKRAAGEWIARIDADDLCALDRLQKQYELAQDDSDLVLIGSGLIEINEIGSPGKTYLYPTSHNALFNRLLTNRAFFAHSSAFYKTEVVRKLGGYRPRFKTSQDWDLWLRFSEIGKFACLSVPLVEIRKHSNQISSEDQGRRQIVDCCVALTSYWLRRSGFVDPVGDDRSEEDFNIFWAWVDVRLQQNNIFDYYAFVSMVKRQSNSVDKPLIKYGRLFLLLLNEPIFVFRYLRTALIGERITQNIASAWIIHCNSGAAE